MPSKKRKYNARFPAGRIKKIMQTDEEVGKVAQAVPIIIYLFGETPRTLELFVESLLSKAMQVTMARNAKTLSPSHVKQCILAESRFDFLRDLVKNIPDVSAAEEKEMMSEENSPNSSRFSDLPAPPRRIARDDSNSSSSCEVRGPRENLKRAMSADTETKPRIETVTSTIVSTDAAIDLSKKKENRPVRTANFYHETLIESQHRSVITVNPTYSSPQPSTSYTSITPVEPIQKDIHPNPPIQFYVELNRNNDIPRTPKTPVTPILNIDFSKNFAMPEIKVLDNAVANIIGVKNEKKLQRQSSKHMEIRKDKPVAPSLDVDHIHSGNLQIDEDYDT